MHPYAAILSTPLPDGARVGLRMAGGVLTEVDFLDAAWPTAEPEGGPARRAVHLLAAYFLDPSTRFDPVLRPRGTPFQRRVWAALEAIPAGEVRTYGQLAAAVGSGPRAVGNACRANPIPLVIPCHRAVAADGAGGFMGRTEGGAMAIKRWLLTHEGVG